MLNCCENNQKSTVSRLLDHQFQCNNLVAEVAAENLASYYKKYQIILAPMSFDLLLQYETPASFRVYSDAQ